MSYFKDKERIFNLYGLYDDNGRLRYVGITSRELKERMWEHLKEKSNTHRVKWINSLKKKGVKPIIKILKNGLSEQDAKATEIEIIALFLKLGEKLTNGTAGGDGVLNPSKEVRDKIGAAHKGKIMSEEARKKMSESHFGKKQPKHVIDGMIERRRGKKLPNTWRENISKGRKGIKFSDLQLENMRLAQLGKGWSKERLAASLAREYKQPKELIEKRAKAISEGYLNRPQEVRDFFKTRINKLTREQLDSAYSKYKDGRSVNSLRKEYNIGMSTMKKYLILKETKNELAYKN